MSAHHHTAAVDGIRCTKFRILLKDEGRHCIGEPLYDAGDYKEQGPQEHHDCHEEHTPYLVPVVAESNTESI